MGHRLRRFVFLSSILLLTYSSSFAGIHRNCAALLTSAFLWTCGVSGCQTYATQEALQPIPIKQVQTFFDGTTLRIRFPDGFEAKIKFSSLFTREDKKTLVSDLTFLANIQGGPASPLHYLVFRGDVSGRVYIEWFSKRINEIGYDFDDSKTSLAYYQSASPFLEYIGLKSKKFFIRPTFFNNENTIGINWRNSELTPNQALTARIMRLGYLMHEARHYDYLHDATPPLTHALSEPYDRLISYSNFPSDIDIRGDDLKPLGAYGTQVEFLLNVAKYYPESNIGPDTVQAAQHILDPYARRVLNEDLVGPMQPKDLAEAIRYSDYENIEKLLSTPLNSSEISTALPEIKTLPLPNQVKILELFAARKTKVLFFPDELTDVLCTDFVNDFSEDFLKWVFITCKIDINMQGPDGNTSLHFASIRKNKKLFNFLIELGADPEIKNKFGLTANEIMHAERDPDTVKRLLDKILEKKSP